MKLEIKELIETVKEELLCYENNEKIAKQWEKEFIQWLKGQKGKNNSIKIIKGKQFFVIKDEGEIFEIADSYMDAVEENNCLVYWKTF